VPFDFVRVEKLTSWRDMLSRTASPQKRKFVPPYRAWNKAFVCHFFRSVENGFGERADG